MPQAIVDPGELRRFAHQLKKFSGELENQLTILRSQMQNLGSSWRDQEHDKFIEEFDQTMKVVARFLEASNQHVPFLLRKARHVEEYLNQR